MKRFVAFLLMGGGMSFSPIRAEHVIMSGGPALRQNENLRVEDEQHDRWWANFIRAATVRIQQLKQGGTHEGITWLVYKKAYESRSSEDGKPYIKYIQDLSKKYGVSLVWMTSTDQIIRVLNSFASKSNKISTFDYFGHSNQSAFLIDYSSDIYGCSTVWLHETELSRLSFQSFTATAVCKSYGCYTGNSMSYYWQQYIKVPLIGCTGKTTYKPVTEGKLPEVSGGSWTE